MWGQRGWVTAAAVLVMLASGTPYSLSAYGEQLKLLLGYSQQTLDSISTLSTLGFFCAFVPGLLIDAKRLVISLLLAFSITTGTYVSLGGLIQSMASPSAWLIAPLYLMIGLGSIFMYMNSLTSALAVTEDRYRGTIVGILDACCTFSTFIFNSFFNALEAPTSSRFTNFFYSVAVITGVLNLLLLLVFLFSSKSKKHSELSVQESETMKVMEAIKSKPFQVLLWSQFFAGGAIIAFSSNVSSIGRSYRLSDKQQVSLSSTVFVSTSVSRVFFGVLSDFLASSVPRRRFLQFALIINCFVFGSLLISKTSSAVLVLAVILCGVSFGGFGSLYPTLVADVFPHYLFGSVWGWLQLATPIANIGYQKLYGSVYERYAFDDGKTCIGLRCYFLTFLISLVFSAIGVVIGFFFPKTTQEYSEIPQDINSPTIVLSPNEQSVSQSSLK